VAFARHGVDKDTATEWTAIARGTRRASARRADACRKMLAAIEQAEARCRAELEQALAHGSPADRLWLAERRGMALRLSELGPDADGAKEGVTRAEPVDPRQTLRDLLERIVERLPDEGA
jgi:hypothetical protein